MQSWVNHLENTVSSALRGFATFLAVRPPSSTYHELETAWETLLEGHDDILHVLLFAQNRYEIILNQSVVEKCNAIWGAPPRNTCL